MKLRFLIITTVFLIAGVITAQEDEKMIHASVQKATVFLQGVQLHSKNTVALSEGTQTLVFDNLPADITEESIQVKGEGSFVVLNVSFRQNYLINKPKTAEQMALEDSIKILSLKIEELQIDKQVYVDEEQMIEANKSIGGEQKGVSVAELAAMANFFRTRLSEVKNKQLEIQRKINKLNERLKQLNNQNALIYQRNNNPVGEIVVSLSSALKQNAQIEITFFSNSAFWRPVYDIKATDVNNPIDLTFRAELMQNTGYDWKNVKLLLSSANPTQNGVKPVLSPWRLYTYDPSQDKQYRKARATSYNQMDMAAPAQAIAEEKSVEVNKVKSESMASFTASNQTQTAVEYAILLPYSVSGNGKPVSVDIQKHQLKAGFRYFCVPKIDNDAFLVAEITGWDELNLLPGESTVYFDGTYLGKTYINPVETGDTLELSLGRDQDIVITREKQKDYSSKKIVGLNKKVENGWDITIRNKKKNAVEIVIQDQIPLSSGSDIEVSADELSGGKYNKDTGEVSWELKINGSESKKLSLKYTVKYPKDKMINL